MQKNTQNSLHGQKIYLHIISKVGYHRPYSFSEKEKLSDLTGL